MISPRVKTGDENSALGVVDGDDAGEVGEDCMDEGSAGEDSGELCEEGGGAGGSPDDEATDNEKKGCLRRPRR